MPFEYSLAFFGIKEIDDKTTIPVFKTENFREYFVYGGFRLMAIDIVKKYLDKNDISLTNEETKKLDRLLDEIKNQDEIRQNEYKGIMRIWKKEKRILKIKQYAAKVAGKLGVYEFLHSRWKNK